MARSINSCFHISTEKNKFNCLQCSQPVVIICGVSGHHFKAFFKLQRRFDVETVDPSFLNLYPLASAMRGATKEWTIPVPWGHIAVVSWGDPSQPRVLLVHGRQDSVASFIPLLDLLPDKYYFVGLDLPGHGRSSPFPPGLMLSRLHMLPALSYLLEHLEWDTFAYMAHSLGTELGKYYNAIYPGQITKIVDLDPAPSMFRLHMRRMPMWYQYFYEQYYQDYARYSSGEMWPYTLEGATRAVQRGRGLTEEQAALVLSRNLVPLPGGKYGLTWDQRLKRLATLNVHPDFYLSLISSHPVPTLTLHASETPLIFKDGVEPTRRQLRTLQETLPHFYIVHVEGGHDVHLTHPERLAEHVREFLERDFGGAKAKL